MLIAKTELLHIPSPRVLPSTPDMNWLYNVVYSAGETVYFSPTHTQTQPNYPHSPTYLRRTWGLRWPPRQSPSGGFSWAGHIARPPVGDHSTPRSSSAGVRHGPPQHTAARPDRPRPHVVAGNTSLDSCAKSSFCMEKRKWRATWHQSNGHMMLK